MSESPQHDWNLTPAQAVSLQKEMAARVVLQNEFALGSVETVAGIDLSHNQFDKMGRAAVVVLRLGDLEIVETATATAEIEFPYVPGLLSFRESPLALAALAKLSQSPDLLMVDGQGIAHPRRFGIACHLGVLTGIPAIGVGKSILCGTHEPLGANVGDSCPLIHKRELIGTVLRSKVRTNPLIVSPGHKITHETAVDMVMRCLRGYRLPEPTRRAHNLAGTKSGV